MARENWEQSKSYLPYTIGFTLGGLVFPNAFPFFWVGMFALCLTYRTYGDYKKYHIELDVTEFLQPPVEYCPSFALFTSHTIEETWHYCRYCGLPMENWTQDPSECRLQKDRMVLRREFFERKHEVKRRT